MQHRLDDIDGELLDYKIGNRKLVKENNELQQQIFILEADLVDLKSKLEQKYEEIALNDAAQMGDYNCFQRAIEEFKGEAVKHYQEILEYCLPNIFLSKSPY